MYSVHILVLLYPLKESESYLVIEHMSLDGYFFLNGMQVKHKLLCIGPGTVELSRLSLVDVEAPLIPEANETSARQRLSGGSGCTS